MARRIRTTVTIREDDPVPRRRSKKKSNAALIIVVLALIGLFLASRAQQPAPFRAQPASLHR
jgi:hypothetical protein